MKIDENQKTDVEVKLRWLSSREAMRALKISGCELMHKRERGELKYRKQGNAYYYAVEE